MCPRIPAAQPQAAPAQTTIPDTPAGQTFKAWLEAFNSGEHAQLDAFYKKYQPDNSADNMMPFRDATGGFELLAIEKSEPLRIEFLVKEHNSDTQAIGAVSYTHLYFDPTSQNCTESTGCRLNPGSVCSKFENVAIISPAPVNSTSERANSPITSASRNLVRIGAALDRPAPSLSESLRLARAAASAGAEPNSAPVATATIKVKANAQPSR